MLSVFSFLLLQLDLKENQYVTKSYVTFHEPALPEWVIFQIMPTLTELILYMWSTLASFPGAWKIVSQNSLTSRVETGNRAGDWYSYGFKLFFFCFLLTRRRIKKVLMMRSTTYLLEMWWGLDSYACAFHMYPSWGAMQYPILYVPLLRDHASPNFVCTPNWGTMHHPILYVPLTEGPCSTQFCIIVFPNCRTMQHPILYIGRHEFSNCKIVRFSFLLTIT